jgi:hypothetical protein
MRRAERHGGGEVVDDLRDDAAPVDGVDAAQLHIVAEALIVEQLLQQAWQSSNVPLSAML